MQPSNTYIGAFKGRRYSLSMSQSSPGSKWRYEWTIFDADNDLVGTSKINMEDSYDTSDDAKAAGVKWVESKLK